MSGPIIRKYGFPNFDQIFGKKEPQHGVEDPAAPASPTPEEAKSPKPKSEPSTGKPGAAKP